LRQAKAEMVELQVSTGLDITVEFCQRACREVKQIARGTIQNNVGLIIYIMGG